MVVVVHFYAICYRKGCVDISDISGGRYVVCCCCLSRLSLSTLKSKDCGRGKNNMMNLRPLCVWRERGSIKNHEDKLLIIAKSRRQIHSLTLNW